MSAARFWPPRKRLTPNRPRPAWTNKSLSQNPIAAAAIEVKVISTVDPPRVIFKGKTAGDGTTVIRCTIPSFKEGTAAIIISAQSPLGNDEIKQLVKRKK